MLQCQLNEDPGRPMPLLWVGFDVAAHDGEDFHKCSVRRRTERITVQSVMDSLHEAREFGSLDAVTRPICSGLLLFVHPLHEIVARVIAAATACVLAREHRGEDDGR